MTLTGAVNDVLRRLFVRHPDAMTEFFGELRLRYDRSGMPGKKALNGPQIDKVWKNLDLLHTLLMKYDAGIIGDSSVDYILKLESLYFMCVRYIFIFL